MSRSRAPVPMAFAAALTLIGSSSRADDLWQVYLRALASDPTYAAASANYRAALEQKPIARSAYLPQLGASGQRQIQRSSGKVPLVFDPTTNSYIETDGRFRSYTTSYTVEITQPVFDWSAWQSIRQANATVAQAEANYVAAQQDLIVRTATAYFDVITARDTLAADRAATRANQIELERTKARFAAGSGTITDVQNAQATYDESVATEIGARQSATNAEEGLRAITGDTVGALSEPSADMPLHGPDPESSRQWVETALRQNPSLMAARAAADAASRSVSIERSGYYPTFSIVASHNFSHLDQYSTIQNLEVGQLQSIAGNSVSLQLNVPIYSGGAVRARVARAQHQYTAAEDQVRFAERQVEQETRTAYLGVLTGMSQVNALRQSVQSNETSLRSMETGLRIGTRTIVDVSLARQNLLAAQTGFVRSRDDYLMSLLRLKQASGQLSADDLKRMSGLLRATVPPDDRVSP
ncbi:MAG: TolC family outer membrane protein [Gammaproteobacteria bacterium]|nr:TolC family outer membrane protein [Gammaproteobacteria bacterium]